MKLFNKIAIFSIAISLFGINSASAKTTISGGPFSNLQTTGQIVNLNLAGYPANSGFYIQQCLHQENWDRNTICNPSAQLWISNSLGANFAPNANIVFKPTATFSYGNKSVDCLKDLCGIFIRLDHTATANNSEDQFIPLSFVGGTTVQTHSDVIKVSINGKTVEGSAPYRLKYKEVLTFVTTTKSGATATITSASSNCTVAANQITAQKGDGYCDIAIASPGSAQYTAVTRHILLKLYPGSQKVLVANSGVAGSSITLPATSNVGAAVTYSVSNTANCTLTGYVLALKKNGDCTIRATAPALADTYSALKQTISINIK